MNGEVVIKKLTRYTYKKLYKIYLFILKKLCLSKHVIWNWKYNCPDNALMST